MHNGFGCWIEFAKSLGQVAQRDQSGARYARNLIFMRFPHVDELELVAGIEPLLQFNCMRCRLSRDGSLRLLRDAAELLVIDERLDGRMVAADGALGLRRSFNSRNFMFSAS